MFILFYLDYFIIYLYINTIYIFDLEVLLQNLFYTHDIIHIVI